MKHLTLALVAVTACGDGSHTVAKVVITPPSTQLAAGTTHQLEATAIYADLTTLDVTTEVTWSSSSSAATITNGLVSAVSPGPSTITATFEGESAAADVVVTSAKLVAISIDPPLASPPRGTTVRLTAFGAFS